MLLDEDFEELLLTEDMLEVIDDRLDELDTLLVEETLMDAALDDATDMDEMLLDMELVTLLELEDAMLTTLLEEALDGSDEVSDELLLMFPDALDELTTPEPPEHADVNADASNSHAITHARRLRMVTASTTLIVQFAE